MTIKGTFIREHSHVKAIFGCSKTVQSKLVPKMAVFENFRV